MAVDEFVPTGILKSWSSATDWNAAHSKSGDGRPKPLHEAACCMHSPPGAEPKKKSPPSQKHTNAIQMPKTLTERVRMWIHSRDASPLRGRKTPGWKRPVSKRAKMGPISLLSLVRPSAGFSVPGIQYTFSSSPSSRDCWILKKWRTKYFSVIIFRFFKCVKRLSQSSIPTKPGEIRENGE